MRNKNICYGTILLFCQFNYFLSVRSNRNEFHEHIEVERNRVKRNDDLQSCLDSFDIHQDKIIRTQDSREMGAKYIHEMDVTTRGDCLRLCCETEGCDVFVFEEKNPGSCYMFACGTPENFKCKFTKHHNYTSGVLAANRHLSELETQIKFTQHEIELTKLREPDTAQSNVSISSIKPTTAPRNKEYLQYGVNSPSRRPERKGCTRNQFECHSDGECIAIYNACDGIAQCQDGSDEAPELQCPVTQVTTGSSKQEIITTVPTPGNSGSIQEGYSNPTSNNREVQLGPPPPLQQKTWIQQQQHPYNGENSNIVQPKNSYPSKTLMAANQLQEGNSPNNRANYGREGEGGYNYHADQPWNYQYRQNQNTAGSSQIFTHKGNGLIPQSDRYIQQHAYIPQDIQSRNNPQQYIDQAPYYYENMPYRVYPPNQQPNKWQSAQQRQPHELSGTMMEENPLNRMEPNGGFNNAPVADYYYEEPFRNRGQPYMGLSSLPNQQKHIPSSSSAEVNNNSDNNNRTSNIPTHPVTITLTTKASPADKKETHSHVHHSHSKVDRLNAETNVKEITIDNDFDGHSSSPSGAILSLSLGLSLTAFMIVVVGCRMKVVRRKMRRGGKSSYAHDPDYLVNGMYL